MQQITTKCLNYKDLPYQVPESVEEFDRLAKRAGAALDEANKNVLYRAVLNQARDGFLHGIEGAEGQPSIDGLDKLTGISRKEKVVKPEVKNEKGEITQEEVVKWDETEGEFADRVFATLVQRGDFPSVEAAEAAYRDHMVTVLAAIAFDPSKQERASAGPRKVPKTYIGVAEDIVKIAGSLEAGIAKFESKTGRKVREQTLEALGRAVWEDQTAQRQKIASGYVG